MASALPDMLDRIRRQVEMLHTLTEERRRLLDLVHQRRAELDVSFGKYTERWRRNVAASNAALASSLAALQSTAG